MASKTANLTATYATIGATMTRSSRSLPLALLLFVIEHTIGCAAAPSPLDPEIDWTGQPSGPGHSAKSGPLAPPRPRRIPVERRRPWAHASELPRFLAVPGRARSDHGLGDLERTVRVDDGARAYAEGRPRGPWPVGARLVEALHSSGSDTVRVLYAMTKLPQGSSPATNDWEFEVLDPEARVAAEGDLSACARCHADAPHDGVFGPPRDSAAESAKKSE